MPGQRQSGSIRMQAGFVLHRNDLRQTETETKRDRNKERVRESDKERKRESRKLAKR